ncbi:hypothetical protein CEUSTIGMA_g11658.t1 [Chlamydomonas eustigma]|uniref:Uncharacterized protein n=1 Tax=Chlamydomonas eustigma TaxID=1157962 RepID=A0A250XMB3_9CHLO|nr:hypothetical protein CEUSTIGMA_g11658.t1 [Chlamydomonas eustigma]|eukprot:GAX84235.1 hypothetical protein CEUSTIGMA_g11658.t1 [Chlamydomonas eustigma]
MFKQMLSTAHQSVVPSPMCENVFKYKPRMELGRIAAMIHWELVKCLSDKHCPQETASYILANITDSEMRDRVRMYSKDMMAKLGFGLPAFLRVDGSVSKRNAHNHNGTSLRPLNTTPDQNPQLGSRKETSSEPLFSKQLPSSSYLNAHQQALPPSSNISNLRRSGRHTNGSSSTASMMSKPHPPKRESSNHASLVAPPSGCSFQDRRSQQNKQQVVFQHDGGSVYCEAVVSSGQHQLPADSLPVNKRTSQRSVVTRRRSSTGDQLGEIYYESTAKITLRGSTAGGAGVAMKLRDLNELHSGVVPAGQPALSARTTGSGSGHPNGGSQQVVSGSQLERDPLLLLVDAMKYISNADSPAIMQDDDNVPGSRHLGHRTSKTVASGGEDTCETTTRSRHYNASATASRLSFHDKAASIKSSSHLQTSLSLKRRAVEMISSSGRLPADYSAVQNSRPSSDTVIFPSGSSLSAGGEVLAGASEGAAARGLDLGCGIVVADYSDADDEVVADYSDEDEQLKGSCRLASSSREATDGNIISDIIIHANNKRVRREDDTATHNDSNAAGPGGAPQQPAPDNELVIQQLHLKQVSAALQKLRSKPWSTLNALSSSAAESHQGHSSAGSGALPALCKKDELQPELQLGQVDKAAGPCMAPVNPFFGSEVRVSRPLLMTAAGADNAAVGESHNVAVTLTQKKEEAAHPPPAAADAAIIIKSSTSWDSAHLAHCIDNSAGDDEVALLRSISMTDAAAGAHATVSLLHPNDQQLDPTLSDKLDPLGRVSDKLDPTSSDQLYPTSSANKLDPLTVSDQLDPTLSDKLLDPNSSAAKLVPAYMLGMHQPVTEGLADEDEGLLQLQVSSPYQNQFIAEFKNDAERQLKPVSPSADHSMDGTTLQPLTTATCFMTGQHPAATRQLEAASVTIQASAHHLLLDVAAGSSTALGEAVLPAAATSSRRTKHLLCKVEGAEEEVNQNNAASSHSFMAVSDHQQHNPVMAAPTRLLSIQEMMELLQRRYKALQSDYNVVLASKQEAERKLREQELVNKRQEGLLMNSMSDVQVLQKACLMQKNTFAELKRESEARVSELERQVASLQQQLVTGYHELKYNEGVSDPAADMSS